MLLLPILVGNPAAGATAPKADFTYFPEPPLVYQLMTFNASSSKANDGTIVRYAWDFGDETSNITETPIVTHAYFAVGPYTVNLTVTDDEGLSDTKSMQIVVLQQPFAIFDYSPKELMADDLVTFNASASSDPDGYITSYFWNFGDGTNGTGEITTHAFTRGGTFTVKLTVTDNDNLTDTASFEDIVVLVHDIAIISVEVSKSTAKIGQTVSISVLVANEGNFSQTFNVTLYYGAHFMETRLVTNLPMGDSETLGISWNTRYVSEGEYTVKAVASVVEGEKESHTDDNTYIDGTVIITADETPPPPLNFFIYAVAAASIIGIALTALYFLRARKQP